MTEDEKLRIEQALKAAWEEGFRAARYWPNHPMPSLQVYWNGSTAEIHPVWSQRKAGYVG